MTAEKARGGGGSEDGKKPRTEHGSIGNVCFAQEDKAARPGQAVLDTVAAPKLAPAPAGRMQTERDRRSAVVDGVRVRAARDYDGES